MARIYSEQRRRRFRRWTAGCGAAAAVFAGGAFFCVSYPSIAANIPLIGNIFERLQDGYGYQGDYVDVMDPLEDEQVAEQLESAGNAQEMEAVSEYTKTSDGLTVTFSEIYCNNQALYATVQLKSEEAFPEILGGFEFETTEQYSFNPTEQVGIPVLEGEMVDECTYVGIMRWDLNDKTTDTSAYEAAREEALAAGQEWDDSVSVYNDESSNWNTYVKTVEIPDEFTLDLNISQIFAALANPDKADMGVTDEEKLAMSDEEWHDFMMAWYQENPDWAEMPNEHQNVIFDGPWSFSLNVTSNTDDTQVVELNDVNEAGIGVEKVVKDRFEITLYDTYEGEASSADYFPVMLDADGRMLYYGGSGSVNTVAINDHDVSRVEIYLMDYMQWMDELKGKYWSDPEGMEADGSLKEMLQENCAYHTQVEFEQ